MADEKKDWFVPATEGAGQEILKEVEEVNEELAEEGYRVTEENIKDPTDADYETEEMMHEDTARSIASVLKEMSKTLEERKGNKLTIVQNGKNREEGDYYNGYQSHEFSIYAPEAGGDNGKALVARGEGNSPEWSNIIGGVTLKDGNISTANGLDVTGGATLDGEAKVTGNLTAGANLTVEANAKVNDSLEVTRNITARNVTASNITASTNFYGDLVASHVFTNCIGYNATANGDNAFTLGDGAMSNGKSSVALGAYSQAIALSAIAIGNEANAMAEEAIAIGANTMARKTHAVAIGSDTYVSAENSIAIGYNSYSSGDMSVTIGVDSYSADEFSVSVGCDALSAYSSVAIGHYTRAAFPNSIAIGSGISDPYINPTSANNYYTIAIGWMAEANGEWSIAIGSGRNRIGTSANDILQTNATGDSAIALGHTVMVNGDHSVGMGSSINVGNSVATGDYAVGIGYSLNVSTYGIAVGTFSYTNGSGITSLGYDANTYFDYATAIGYTAGAYENATAIGVNAAANGAGAIAIGTHTTVSMTNSIAIGQSAETRNTECITIGNSTQVGINGNGCVAIGYNTKSNGPQTVAIGLNAHANNYGSVAIGVNTHAGMSNTIAIGSNTRCGWTEAIAIGYGIDAVSQNSMQNTYIGGSNQRYFNYWGTLTNVSDVQDKFGISNLNDAKSLQLLTSLNTFTYFNNLRARYKYKKLVYDEETQTFSTKFGDDYDKASQSQGTRKFDRMSLGVSAQEVVAKLEELYGDSTAYDLISDSASDTESGEEHEYSVSYMSFIPLIISALKEQQREIDELKTLCAS